MKKHFIPILVILLFISSSFIGLSNQLDEPETDIEQEVLLDHLAFYCTDADGLDTAKFDYRKEKLLEESFDDEIDEVEIESPSVALNPIVALDSPPMDSPWPMKCHDTHHTSRSPYGTANNSYYELWRYEFSWKVDSDPAIGEDGTIYVGGSESKLPWFLFAINPNGTMKWSYKTDGLIWNMCPAIAEDGTIYVGSWDGYLHAVNPNGTRKWRFYTNDDIVSDPVIGDGGTIYFGTMWGTGGGGKIFAVNPDGSEKWHYKTDYHITSDPAIDDDGTIYIGSGDDYLYAMNPNGTMKWKYRTGDWVKAPPSIADDGTIYISSYDDYLYALYPDGTLRWKTEKGFGSDTNPSIGTDGTIYVNSINKLKAINPDGSKKWEFKLGGSVKKSSSAICADGIVYTGIEIGDRKGGEIVALNPDGTERWRKRLSNHWVDSSPCIGEDGTVYIVSTNSDYSVLHAFGELDPNAPFAPDINGKKSGKVEKEYEYTFTTTDPNGDDIYYWIEWGDGKIEDWMGPYPSGEEVTINHTWSEKGTYIIKARAKDTDSLWGPWGELEVTMPKIKQSTDRYFLQFLEEHPHMFPILRQSLGLE